MLHVMPTEEWKNVQFNFEYTNDFRLEISNFGRIRTFHKFSNGNIINGSAINGYNIVRLKFYKRRDEKKQMLLDDLEQQIKKLSGILKLLALENADENVIKQTEEELQRIKKKRSRLLKQDTKERTIHHHALLHRLVAEYFLPKPHADETIVAHLDYNKQNNRAWNLKWMTPEENYKHQQKSPEVIREKNERKTRRKNTKNVKLTVTKVMLLKKLLNQGKPMKQLVKQFKITDTQILRIKAGKNWADIEAAK